MKKRILSLVMAVAAFASVAGCGTKEDDGNKVTEISWYVPAVLEGKDVQEVLDTANALLAERYGLKLNLNCVDNGNYNSKMQVMNAGREEYDLVFTSNWTNDFYKNVSNGVFYDISKDLPVYAPKLYESMSEAEKQAVTFDGGIYAVPNWQIQAKSTALLFDKERLESTGMTLDQINSLDDVTAYLRKVHEIAPDCNIISDFWSALTFYNGINEIVEEGLPPAIYFNKDGKPQIINQYETQEFEDYVKLRHQWTAEGIATNKYDPNVKASNKDVRREPFAVSIYKPGIEADYKKSVGYDVVGKPFSEAVLSTAGINAALTGVSATSKHPQDAVRMLEVMHTDKEIYNLICWGIEGKHYNKISDNKIEITEGAGYSRIPNWEMASIANSYLLSSAADDVVEKTEEYNNSAKASPIIGMQFSVDNIATEMANCRTVVNEQLQMLELGLTDDVDAKLAKFREDLKISGVDSMIEELQKQLDEWWATK